MFERVNFSERIKKVETQSAAGCAVDGDGQIEPASLFVEREKTLMAVALAQPVHRGKHRAGHTQSRLFASGISWITRRRIDYIRMNAAPRIKELFFV